MIDSQAANLLGRHVTDRAEHQSRLSLQWTVGARSRSPRRIDRWVSFASPKSRILTRLSGLTNTFSGLRSRWMIPLSCAAVRPRVDLNGVLDRLTHWHRPRLSNAHEACSPSSNSDTMNGAPPCWPMLYRTTMFGWFRAAAARASCSNRCRRSTSAGECAEQEL